MVLQYDIIINLMKVVINIQIINKIITEIRKQTKKYKLNHAEWYSH